MLVTAVLGGLIGAGAVYGAGRYLVDAPAGDVGTRLTRLEQTPRPAAGPADTAATDRRLAALEAANKQLSEQMAQRPVAASDTPVGGTSVGGVPVGAVSGGAAPSTAGPAPASVEVTDALATRLSSLESQTGQLTDISKAVEDLRSQVAPLRTGLDDLQAKIAPLGTGLDDLRSQVDPLRTGLDDLRSQIAALRTGLDDQIKQSGAAAKTNESALSEISARLSALQSQSAGQAAASATTVQALQARLGDGEKRLDSLSAELAKFGPAAAQAGLRVIVSGRLSDALSSAQPLGPLLETAQKIGAPEDTLAPLRVYATQAAPSAAELAREFEPLARRMIETARGPATSIGDRLLRMADRLVTVRDVGDTAGSDVPAQVHRVEAALDRGSLSEAVSAWAALPEDVKAPATAWATKLKQREAASDAARRLSTDALASIDSALR